MSMLKMNEPRSGFGEIKGLQDVPFAPLGIQLQDIQGSQLVLLYYVVQPSGWHRDLFQLMRFRVQLPGRDLRVRRCDGAWGS